MLFSLHYSWIETEIICCYDLNFLFLPIFNKKKKGLYFFFFFFVYIYDFFPPRHCCPRTTAWWTDLPQMLMSTSWCHQATSCSCRSWTPPSAGELNLLTRRDVVCLWNCLWPLLSFVLGMCLCMCAFVRSGFSQPGQRSLLKKALGVLAGRLKEGGAELTLEQLVKWVKEFKSNTVFILQSVASILKPECSNNVNCIGFCCVLSVLTESRVCFCSV